MNAIVKSGGGMGIHAQHTSNKAEVRDYIRKCKPGIILWCSDFDAQLMAEAKAWGAINVVRRWFPDDQQWLAVLKDPKAAADECAKQVYEMFKSVWHLVDYAVGFNEYWGSDKPSEAECEAAYQYEKWMHECMNLDYGMLYPAYSMHPGGPSPEQWVWILNRSKRDGIKFPGDAYAAHAYWRTPNGPLHRDSYDPDAPYLIAREFLMGPQCPVPILYTEVGYDNYQSGAAKRGWQRDYQFPGRDEVYANQFADFCNLMADYAAGRRVTVIGATGFTVGYDTVWTASSGGTGHDYTGIGPIADKMAAWPKQHIEYEEEPPVPIDKTELLIRDKFNRANCQWNPDDAFGKYILNKAKAWPYSIVEPMPSPNGQWQNFNLDDRYIIAYTLPTLVCNKATGEVTEGNPFRGG